MGWKSIKEHYKIGHHVQVTDKGICIGSGYIHDLIVIRPWAKTIEKTSLGLKGNSDLERYWAEMNADLDKLWELGQAEDTFDKSITVYTYKGSDIQERACEELGWPNVTHDGQMMYENTFSPDRRQVIEWAIRESNAIVSLGLSSILELEQDLAKARKRVETGKADVVKLQYEALRDDIAMLSASPLKQGREG